MNKLELAKLLASLFETPLSQAADDTDELVRKKMVQRKRGGPRPPAQRNPAERKITPVGQSPKSSARSKRAD